MIINHHGIDKVEKMLVRDYGTKDSESVYDVTFDVLCYCESKGFDFGKLLRMAKKQAKLARS